MNQDELLEYLINYACDFLTYEERHSIPLDKWQNFVKEHFKPIPKAKCEIGKVYKGNCRNASKAIWTGKVFVYKRYKLGDVFEEEINHYEDYDGYDVFVPIETDLI